MPYIITLSHPASNFGTEKTNKYIKDAISKIKCYAK